MAGVVTTPNVAVALGGVPLLAQMQTVVQSWYCAGLATASAPLSAPPLPRSVGSLPSVVGPGSCGAVDTPRTAASRRGPRMMLAVVGWGVAILVPKTTRSEVRVGERNAHQRHQDQDPGFLTVRTWSQQ